MNDEETRSVGPVDEETRSVDQWRAPRPVSTTPAPVAHRRRRRAWWLVPLLAVGAGAASFALVTAAMNDGRENLPTTPTTVAGAAPSGTPSPQATASTGPADFPAEAVTTCMQDDVEVPNERAADVRMKAGAQTSCAFLASARSEVVTHLAGEESASSFTVRPYSVPLKTYVDLTCTRSQGFTYCEGGRSARVWIRTP